MIDKISAGIRWLRVRRFAREEGQDLAEYAILVALIAVVAAASVQIFGQQLVAAYNEIVAALPW
jgi:Flp pilus assembly pilin Flp